LDFINEKTKLIWLESPTNPTLKISDIQKIAEIAHSFDALVVVDNTFASPIAQLPLELGADIVVHSATKYLGGHNDVLAGLIVAKGKELCDTLGLYHNATGAVLSPFDSWLLIRGMKKRC